MTEKIASCKKEIKRHLGVYRKDRSETNLLSLIKSIKSKKNGESLDDFLKFIKLSSNEKKMLKFYFKKIKN